MNGLGDHLLTSSRFPGEQDRGTAGGHLSHEIEHPLHALALANDVRKTIALLEGAFQEPVLLLQAPLGNDVPISTINFSLSQGLEK